MIRVQRRRDQLLHDRGFSLVEVLIAVIILGISGVAILNAITTSDKSAAKVSAKATGFNSIAAAAQLLQAAAWASCEAGDAVPAAYSRLRRPTGVSIVDCRESGGKQTLTLSYVPIPNPDSAAPITRVVFKTNRLATQLLTLIATVNGAETTAVTLPPGTTTSTAGSCTGVNQVRVSAVNREANHMYELYFFSTDGGQVRFNPELPASSNDPYTCVEIPVPAQGQSVTFTIGAVDLAAAAGRPNEAKAVALTVTGG